MVRSVREFMNPELFSVEPGVKIDDLLDSILALGITAVPVLDEQRRPLGVTSLRDLVRGGKEHPISAPALTVPVGASIEDAARVMCETGRHHLVVVGSDGRAAGMLSTLDIVRALIGFPAQHAAPSSFPHGDAKLGVVWTSPIPLDAANVATSAHGAGILVLSAGAVQRSEGDVWVEPCAALRARLVEMLQTPQDDRDLARILRLADLRFRFASCADPDLRESVARMLRARIVGAGPARLAEARPRPSAEAAANGSPHRAGR